MASFKINVFGGIQPKLQPRLLEPAFAQIAQNCKLFGGDLQSWRRPKSVATPSKASSGTVKAIFRMNNGTTDFWLNWLTDVHCVRGPVAGDTTQRIYFTGDGEPRMSNLSLATSGGSDYPVSFYVLGVFPPKTAPTVSPSGGTGAAQSRAYLYTFVTQFGEESAPSPASAVVTGKVDDTWALSNLDTAPPNSFAVTGASWSSGVATLNVASTFGLRAGEEINVTGVNPSGYNGKFTLTEVNAGNVKYALATNPGAYVSGGTVARVAPHNTTGMTKRIYRTNTGSAQTKYQFVAEIPAATTTYNDTVADAALGEVLEEPYNDQPPTDMRGLVEFPNGVIVGFSKNELCPSKPYKPHAFPDEYRLRTTREIVGIAVFGSSIGVATKAEPYIVTGNHPESWSMDKVEGVEEPCLSTRSVVSVRTGVLYASPNGLVHVPVVGNGLATEVVVTKKEWEQYYPATILATEYQGRYFGFYTSAPGVGAGFIFDRSGAGPDLVGISYYPSAVYTDAETGDLYLVVDGEILKWDGDDNNNLPYDWKSRVWVAPKPISLAAARVDFDTTELAYGAAQAAQKAADDAYNATVLSGARTWPQEGVTKGAVNSSMLDEFAVNASKLKGGADSTYDTRSLQLIVYADAPAGTKTFTKNVTSKTPFRLPAGFTANEWEIRLVGNVRAYSVEVAETMKELGRV